MYIMYFNYSTILHVLHNKWWRTRTPKKMQKNIFFINKCQINIVATLNVTPTLNVAPDVICRKADAKCRNQR